jgi:ADP-heptose:LPS heptosyltransferase
MTTIKTIVIAPYAQVLRNGKNNPKNYPHWNKLIELLNKEFYIIQIGATGEKILNGIGEARFNLQMKEIEELIKDSYTWISVDSFLPHLVNCMKNKKPGVVLWSQSNPKIFGYDYNVNILKSKLYLRPSQFDIWENTKIDSQAYFPAETVYEIMKNKLKF